MKNNLLTIISTEPVDCNELIRNKVCLDKHNICIRNVLLSSTVNINDEIDVDRHIVLLLIPSFPSVVNSIDKNKLKEISLIHKASKYVILVSNSDVDDDEEVKFILARNGMVTTEWGGDVNFIYRSQLIDSIDLDFKCY